MAARAALDREARFTVRLADSDEDVRAAQCLRYRVFAGEMGADIDGGAPGVDEDEFDEYCDHVLLIDPAESQIVGTYRILSDDSASELGHFYSETEFELGAVRRLPRLFELGRACVAPHVRTGIAIATLMAGVAQHLRSQGCRYVIGTSSLHVLENGGDEAKVRNICARVVRDHPSPPELRVKPHNPFALGGETGLGERRGRLPGLLRAYLRLGAYVCGKPAWDPGFRTADLLLLLDMKKFDGRFADRLQRAA